MHRRPPPRPPDKERAIPPPDGITGASWRGFGDGIARLSLFFFGSPRIELGSLPLSIDLRKAAALRAYLAVTRQQYSRDSLAALLWPESDQSHARAALRRTLF